jgi:DNA-binding Lrp family transcriptional regulator
MKLSTNQKTILATCGLQADLELTEVAKRCRLQVASVRYALDTLRDREVIRKLWIINPWRFGWSRYNIFFSIGLSKKELRDKLFKEIINNPYCSFFTELGGNFDYELSILAPNELVAMQFFQTLTEKFGVVFRKKLILPRTEIAHFTRKYLSPKSVMQGEVRYGVTAEKISLTEVDHKLLSKLAKDGYKSLRSIAQELNIPASTIEYHFKRLREQKVIVGCVYAISNAHYGAFSYELQIFAKGFDRALKEQLYNFTKQHLHCTHFIECFGSADYSIGVETQSYQELVSLREELADKFDSSIAQIEVLSRLAVRKYSAYPFLENPSVKIISAEK